MIKLGMAFCGSFCTTKKAIEVCKKLKEQGYDITPIFSEHVIEIDTRFGDSTDVVCEICHICQNQPIFSIVDAEPIGPKSMFDVLAIAPCTGNTLAKLANAITDNTVTMATKSHLRNGKPVVISLATNDGLSASAVNLANLLNRKNYYFVPFGQDDYKAKPCSLVADLDLLSETIDCALKGKQMQPILV